MLAADGVLRTRYAGDATVSGAFFMHLRELYFLTHESFPVLGDELAAQVVVVEQGRCVTSSFQEFEVRGPEAAAAAEARCYGELLCAALDVGSGDAGRDRL